MGGISCDCMDIHSLSTPAYAVFLKKRPGNQVQLGPRIFVSFALSQDMAMDIIAVNLFGPSPFRWLQLEEWKQKMRAVFGCSGNSIEEIHHFGAELLLPRRCT